MSCVSAFNCILFAVFVFSKCSGQECEANEGKEWYYDNSLSNGPERWTDNNPECMRDNQSPIDIQPTDAEPIVDSEGLQLKNYDQPISNVKIENLGYTIRVTPDEDIERAVILDGVPYIMKEFNFHWGNKSINDSDELTSTPGSEHKINGKQYAMEMQILHENEDKDMVIIGVLFDDSDYTNPAIEAIQIPIESYKFQNGEYDGDLDEDYDTNINISSLVQNGVSYFQYNGSLTQPPCTGNVTWLILQNPSFVATSQLLKFEDLYSVEELESSDENDVCKIINNFRETQPINDRIVYYG